MALYDSADCLLRVRDAAQLPDDDEAMTDAAWYRLLTKAQAVWYPAIATHVPRALVGAPEVLESADGGLTYPFGDDEDGRPILPLGVVQVFKEEWQASEPDPEPYLLRDGVDYVAEAALLRFRTTATTTDFPDAGPWVRMIEPPGVLDADHEPVLYPVHARELLVLGAVEAWATQGGLRDPGPWMGAAQRLWSGTGPGDVGLMGALKLQYRPRSARRGAAGARVPSWSARTRGGY